MDKASSLALERLTADAARPPLATGDRRDCGDFDIRMGRDGSWFYRSSSIHRMALVRLFSRTLECGARQRLIFRTNVDEIVILDAAHALRMEEDRVTRTRVPYILRVTGWKPA